MYSSLSWYLAKSNTHQSYKTSINLSGRISIFTELIKIFWTQFRSILTIQNPRLPSPLVPFDFLQLMFFINRLMVLEMSTIKTTRLIVHRNNTCKVPLVSSPFLVSCGFSCAQLWQPSCSVLFCLRQSRQSLY